jgi:hypothetical protein
MSGRNKSNDRIILSVRKEAPGYILTEDDQDTMNGNVSE